MECVFPSPSLLAEQSNLPQRTTAILQDGTAEQILSNLSQTALDPTHTDHVLAYFEPLAPELCLRWPRGSSAATIAALGRALTVLPRLEDVARYMLQDDTGTIELLKPLDSALSVRVQDNEPGPLRELLAGVLRLLSFDNQTYARHIQPARLQVLLRDNDRVIRYLTIRILTKYLHASDSALESMIAKYIGEEEITGPYESKTIDYRFWTLWEDSRLQGFSKACLNMSQHLEAEPRAAVKRTFREADLSNQVAVIANRLFLTSGCGKHAGATTAFVPTPTTLDNLRSLASALDSKEPVLLTGQGGSGKTHLMNYLSQRLGKASEMVTLHLNEQSDAKLLIGIYATGSEPGTFEWRPGVLTTAVREGRWVLIEDLDRAPVDVMSTILPLIERREIVIPSRGETIAAASGFRVFATLKTHINHQGQEYTHSSRSPGSRLWRRVQLKSLHDDDLRMIIAKRFANLQDYLPQILATYRAVKDALEQPRSTSISVSRSRRQVTSRELLKWCERLSGSLILNKSNRTDRLVPESFLDSMFLDSVDCFAGHLEDEHVRASVEAAAARELHLDPQRRDHLSRDRQISLKHIKGSGAEVLTVGRIRIPFHITKSLSISKSSTQASPFATNRHTLKLLERIAVSVHQQEPVLLVGETGIGKTTAIQHLSSALGHQLIAINLSQQSESGDLLGGYKPLSVSSLAVPLKDEFELLFEQTFSQKKNQKFMQMLSKCVARAQWKRAVALWREALKMVEEALKRQNGSANEHGQQEQASKRRKLDSSSQSPNKAAWDAFTDKLTVLEKQLSSTSKDSMIFSFVEGKLVSAVRNGHWVLLDEINLATPDTLECLSELLEAGPDASRSLMLAETGSTERITAHKDFRIFAAMNPSNDVGKKDLPPGIKSRFTEFYVDSPDRDKQSLTTIVAAYLERSAQQKADNRLPVLVAELYQEVQHTTLEQGLVDGSNQPPVFSLRTLTRALSHAVSISSLCNIRRAIYEGFALCFFTSLDARSEDVIKKLVKTKLFGSAVSAQAEIKKPLRSPSEDGSFVPVTLRIQPTDRKQETREERTWLPRGHQDTQDPAEYIITEYISKNLQNLIRAASTRKYPVLIQGPTSAGKTSMVEYLAKRSGNTFVRINNHEHTDLQEYLGTYVSTAEGHIVFQEGVLVDALRKGYWVVLDELNLAPTDVLEALNRLLDENRELLIPETQEIVRPHPNFMLFATQNPAGPYGGRKALSRAFRNRFIELHFDDIPVEELNIILARRSNLPESWCALIVEVYKQLARIRQKSRVFEQNSFATLRDLFRWAFRGAESVEELARNGFMLLAEKVRTAEERESVKSILEKHMSRKGTKIQIDEDHIYGQAYQDEIDAYEKSTHSSIVWTKAMRRLYVLVAQAIKHNEAILLVGETGCGKTTVCQMIAEACTKELHMVNAHQNLETGDLIGAQRPRRNRAAVEAQLQDQLMHALSACGRQDLAGSTNVDQLAAVLSKLDTSDLENIPTEVMSNIAVLKAKARALFEWQDGSIVRAMKEGHFFLLDEISLADDSVLERLNSVLDPQRTILLAEKGAEGSFVVANPGFQFFATMNPGGDYGKKELSPALRNRFTEIWVPPMSRDEDMLLLVSMKLIGEAKSAAFAMIEFGKWFEKRFRPLKESALSIRDMLTWVDFVNSCTLPTSEAVVQGAYLVYVDTLGANPSAMLAMRNSNLEAEKQACRSQLQHLVASDSQEQPTGAPRVEVTSKAIQFGPFKLQRSASAGDDRSYFTFDAPTTCKNAVRIARGLQLKKPLLLEGNPGVGKTSVVSALAAAVGKPLVRLNLSEQTDIMDLFGSDVPVEDAAAGVFAWRDAPFLAAMKRGDWVLLDEMNLASQSVLEGLNACLDHRAEVYIPELEQSFRRHPDFRLFAAQNPHSQGGGRKGLPASFVNRFTVIYMDVLEHEDLLTICRKVAGDVKEATLSGLISFVTRLDQDVGVYRKFGARGSPWEFNLRDCLRALQLLTVKEGLLASCDTTSVLKLLFTQRFRTVQDSAAAQRLAQDTLELDSEIGTRSGLVSVTPMTIQVGSSLLARSSYTSSRTGQSRLRAKGGLPILESMMISVQLGWPVLLIGTSGSGKSSLVQSLAAATGACLDVFPLSADIDASDLVGGYEQVDRTRHVRRFFDTLLDDLKAAWVQCQQSHVEADVIESLMHVYSLVTQDKCTATEACRKVLEMPKLPETASIRQICSGFASFQKTLVDQEDARFEWVDGTLVTALETGNWLLLDNANLCSASVLDRLNSLLEPGGSLILSEHCNPDGSPKIVRPHPNFRLFLTVDPQYGEISRAMRNRTVELYVSRNDSDSGTVQEESLLESAVARFDDLSRFSQRGPFKNPGFDKIMATALDNLAVSDIKLLPRFSIQVSAGLIHGLQESPVLEAACENLFDTAASNEGYYAGLLQAYKSATTHVSLMEDLTFLPINAIRNDQVVRIGHLPLFELLSTAHHFLLALVGVGKQIQTQLDWGQKTATSKMDVRARAQRLVRSLYASLYKRCSSTFDGQGDPSSVFLLCLFLVIVLRLLKTSISDDTVDPFFVEAVVRRSRQYLQDVAVSHPEISPTTDSFMELMLEFGESQNLKSGQSMDLLWQHLRQGQSTTFSSIQALMQLENIAARLDSLIPHLFISAKEMIPLRNSIIDALASGQAHNSLQIESLDLPDTDVGSIEDSDDEKRNSQLLSRAFTSSARALTCSNILGRQDFGQQERIQVECIEILAGMSTVQKSRLRQSLGSAHNLDIISSVTCLQEDDASAFEMVPLKILSDLRGVENINLASMTALRDDITIISKHVVTHIAEHCADRSVLLAHALEPLTSKIQQLLKTHSGSEDPEFRSILSDLEDVEKQQGIHARQTVAYAYIRFASHSISIYTPDQVLDPATARIAARRLHLEQISYLTEYRGAIMQVNELLTGSVESLELSRFTCLVEQLGQPPEDPRVFRPQKSRLGELQPHFSGALRVAQAARAMLNDTATGQGHEAVLKDIAQVVDRLSNFDIAYRDLTSLLIGFLHCLQLGLTLKRHEEEMRADHDKDVACRVLKVLPLYGRPLSSNECTAALIGLEKQGIEDATDVLAYVKFLRSTSQLQDTSSTDILGSVSSSFEHLHSLWSARLQQDQKAAEQASSTYTYRGATEDEEVDDAAIQEMFTLAVRKDQDAPYKTTPQALAVLTARRHLDIFISSKRPGDDLLQLLRRFSTHPKLQEYAACDTPDKVVPMLIIMLANKKQNLEQSVDTRKYNIFTDANVVEVTRVSRLAAEIKARTAEIQKVWPEQATLQNIIDDCNSILAMSWTEPIMAYLAQVEKLHVSLWQWQSIASREFSLGTWFDQATQMIISWRRLELSTWARLLEIEEEKMHDQAYEWWFPLYENVLVAPFAALSSAAGQDPDSTPKLLEALDQFLLGSTTGQFRHRFDMIKSLYHHSLELSSDQPHLLQTTGSICNFLDDYNRYLDIVSSKIADRRRELEKEVKEVVLLASWKDTNVEALKQSSRVSHRKLFRIVRKFQDFLGNAVQPFLGQSMGDLQEKQDPLRKHSASNIGLNPAFFHEAALAALERDDRLWSQRPTRYRQLSTTASLLRSKMSKTDELLPYAKTLDEFVDDTISTAKELRQATPATSTEENAPVVKHLTARKRRLFADSLKELRRMGFSWNHNPETLQKQSTKAFILSHLPARNSTAFESHAVLVHEPTFFEALDLMPRIRASVKDHSDELNTSDLSRSVGLFEGLMALGIETTKRVFYHGKLCDELEALHNKSTTLWDMDGRACVRGSGSDLSDHVALSTLVSWIKPVLEVGLKVLQSQASLGELDFRDLLQELQQHLSVFEQLQLQLQDVPAPPPGLLSTRQCALDRDIIHAREQLNITLKAGIDRYPNAAVVLVHVLQSSRSDSELVSDATRTNISVERKEVESKLYDCLDLCLAAAQDVEKTYNDAQPNIEDNGWMLSTGQWFSNVLAAFNADKIRQAYGNAQSLLQQLENEQDFNLATASFAASMPLLQNHFMAYKQMVLQFHDFAQTIWDSYARLGRLFCSVATQGFCKPAEPSDEKGETGEKLEGGTGLGEGEGAENISKEVGDDEDMSELAQENQDGGDKEQDGENDDAVDVEEDLKNAMGEDVDKGEGDEEQKDDPEDAQAEDEVGEAGDDTNADGTEGKDEGQDETMDEGLGEVDDFEPSAVDEKMWDEATNEEPEKQGKQEMKNQKDEQAASREDGKGQENTADDGEDDEDDEMQDDGEDDAGDKAEGLEEEMNAMDPHLQDTDALDLPDDMQLDGDKGDDDKDDIDSDLDIPDEPKSAEQEEDIKEGELEEEDPTLDPSRQPKDNLGDEQDEGKDDVADDDEKTAADQTVENNANDANAEDAKDDTTGGTDASKGGRQSEQNQTANGEEEQDQDNQEDQSEQDQAAEQSEQQGKQSSSQARGPSSVSKPEQSQAEAKDRESIKKLGDIMEKWHRQQREIQDTQDRGQQEQQDVDMADADFEHLPDDEAQADAQALGASTQEQARALDQDNQVGRSEDVADNDPETFQADEVSSEDEDMQDAPDAEQPSAHETQRATSPTSTRARDQAQDEEDLDTSDPLDIADEPALSLELSPAPPSQDPSALWAHYESLTTPLAHSLTESLRLILAPTLATKLRGDFRTGKRLNIKRIIPFIASGYKRDKIWLRRSIPSKRAYQVLLALDDSKSMGGRAADLAFQTLALVGKSLSMLEVGEIGVLGFGERTTTAHELGKPLTSDAGAAMMSAFTFEQGRTDVRKLVAESLHLLSEARLRAQGSEDLWQLEIVISDGICEDHEGIRRLLLRAVEMRVMIIFVVVDGGGGGGGGKVEADAAGKKQAETSIADLERVEFVPGPPGADGQPGQPRLVRQKYLDTFPFGYYLMVKDVDELPGVLSQALRQWFAEVAER